ncbi:putative gustatory receptor 58b [Musca domestica]|uniref:Gustatory receptor 58b n=1 Tax=Musca domestica TaxID=7370 RepID=A0ABM3V1V6_MUSDO|nr:putative gustatory receptor 58b [Musca domestica]
MEPYMQQELATVRTNTIYKFCVCHSNAIIMSILFIRMQKERSWAYVLMILVNFLQSQFLLQVNVTFDLILFRMHLHFVFINKVLEHTSQRITRGELFWSYWTLYNMHYECYHLSQRILRIWQDITFFWMIKIFTTNIALLYHAVQFTNGSIESDNTQDLIGTMTIVLFYWDTTLTMKAIDGILSSCNQTNEVLRIYANEKGERGHLHQPSQFLKMAS